MLITAYCAAGQLIPSLSKWTKEHDLLALSLYFASIVIYFVIQCCEGLSRSFPINYILYLIFTVCQAFFFNMIMIAAPIVNMGITTAMTVVMIAGLTVYAGKTPRDFTILLSNDNWCYLFCLIIVLHASMSWFGKISVLLLIGVYGLVLIYHM